MRGRSLSQNMWNQKNDEMADSIKMVGNPGPTGGRSLNRGDLDLDICPHNYECETCEIEHQFLQEMKRVIEHIRPQT